MHTIKFNKDVITWTNDSLANYMYLTHTIKYFEALIKVRGYVYLNTICEYLGIGWDPRNKNLCFINDFDVRFELVEDGECDYLINIIY